MTKKLYDENAYLKEFDGTVVSCEEAKEGFKVRLDRTAFFPEEGGQSPDKGTLGDAEVTHVEIKGDEIYHYVSKPFKEGETLHGIIDWEHRFRNMQMHSAEHIFSGLVYSKFGFSNVGFHLSDNSATMDYDGKLTREDVRKLELEANRVIVSDRRIKAEYPGPEALALLEYRSKKALSGPVRIVTVEDVDVCACCAPHVSTTGQIGMLKIISVENYKSGVRINYLAGFRALLDYESRIESLNNISQTLSAKAGEEVSKVSKLSEDFNKLKFDYVSLKNRLIELNIKNEITDKKDGKYICPSEDSQYMRFIMESLRKVYPGTCVVLCGGEEEGYRYLIESSEKDLSGVSALLREKFGAKGGGRNGSIQGTVNCDSESVFALLDI